MRNGTYTARRRADVKEWRGNATREFGMGENFGAFSTGFSRNRNTIKFSGSKKLGSMALVAVFFTLLLNLGLIYVDQSAKATNFDYKLSGLSTQIDDLEAKKSDLAVERARLTSIAKSNNSKVAAAMVNSGAAEYAE